MTNNEEQELENEILPSVEPATIQGEYELVVNITTEENNEVHNKNRLNDLIGEDFPRSDDFLDETVLHSNYSDRYQTGCSNKTQVLHIPVLNSSSFRSKCFSVLNILFIDSLENTNSHISPAGVVMADTTKAVTNPPIALSSDYTREIAETKLAISAESIFRRGAKRSFIRVLTIVCTAMVAYLIPNIGLLVSLTGASSGAALGLIMPCAIDLAQSQQLYIKLSKWRIVLNVTSISLGIFGGLAGTIYVVREILNM